MSDRAIPITSSKPNNDATRRASMARLSSPLSISHNTPTSSHFQGVYQNRNGSNSSSLLDHINNTPVSRKNHFANRASSPAIDTDDEDENLKNSPKSSYGSTIEESSILKNVSKHLPSDAQNSLKLQSGDITRDLYQLNNKPKMRRSKSLTGNDILGERRGSVASHLRVPGGFRRDYIQTKKQKFGYTLEDPTPLTRNFLEFLSIYGHFAGENLEDEDFLACDYNTSDDKTDEESPLIAEDNIPSGKPKGKTSTIKSFFLLLKAFIGTGVLFLPKAFSNGGLFFSVLLLIFFSILSYYCYLVLSQSTIKSGITSFADLGFELYGTPLKYLILISIVTSQIGFVAAYTVFTAENLKAFVFNTIGLKVPLYYVVIFETVFFIPMSLIRNITKLSLAALLANIFILSGIITIVFYSSSDLIKNGPADVKMFNSNSWSLFIGVAIFAFEGIGLIIPVQQSMKHPQDFPKILLAVISVCCCLFIGIGWLGYITYGDDVKTVVILNLPQTSIPVILIQFFYALAIMLSVPLQLLPAIRILESRIFKRKPSGRVDLVTKWQKNTFRVLVVILTSTVAYLGSSNLDLFVSFVGSFACIPLVYMYPPMLHMKAVAESKWEKGLDLGLAIFGGVALIYTTFQLLG